MDPAFPKHICFDLGRFYRILKPEMRDGDALFPSFNPWESQKPQVRGMFS